MVNPASPEATGLAYTAQASTSKHEKYAPPAACGNCVMYAGKPGDEAGPCPLFIGNRVAAAGWCSGYNKRG
jgi:High potential iron-sulfur protein